MPKIFYGLTVAAVACAAILLIASYILSQTTGGSAAAGYYLNLGLLTLAGAPVLAAIGHALELLERIAASTESTRFLVNEMNRDR